MPNLQTDVCTCVYASRILNFLYKHNKEEYVKIKTFDRGSIMRDFDENLVGTPCISFSRPSAPAVSARSNVGGGCIGNVALCWRRITFINLTLPARHIHGRSMHTRGRTCMEPFAITRTYSLRRKRQLLLTRTKQRPVAPGTFVHIFNGHHFASDKSFE